VKLNLEAIGGAVCERGCSRGVATLLLGTWLAGASGKQRRRVTMSDSAHEAAGHHVDSYVDTLSRDNNTNETVAAVGGNAKLACVSAAALSVEPVTCAHEPSAPSSTETTAQSSPTVAAGHASATAAGAEAPTGPAKIGASASAPDIPAGIPAGISARPASSSSSSAAAAAEVQAKPPRKRAREGYNFATLDQLTAPPADKSTIRKGDVHILKGVAKAWDGRQWRKVCTVRGCAKYAISNYRCTRHSGSNACMFIDETGNEMCHSKAKKLSHYCASHESGRVCIATSANGDACRELAVPTSEFCVLHHSLCSATGCQEESKPGTEYCEQHASQGLCKFVRVAEGKDASACEAPARGTTGLCNKHRLQTLLDAQEHSAVEASDFPSGRFQTPEAMTAAYASSSRALTAQASSSTVSSPAAATVAGWSLSQVSPLAPGAPLLQQQQQHGMPPSLPVRHHPDPSYASQYAQMPDTAAYNAYLHNYYPSAQWTQPHNGAMFAMHTSPPLNQHMYGQPYGWQYVHPNWDAQMPGTPMHHMGMLAYPPPAAPAAAAVGPMEPNYRGQSHHHGSTSSPLSPTMGHLVDHRHEFGPQLGQPPRPPMYYHRHEPYTHLQPSSTQHELSGGQPPLPEL
jgi:hypothetical protein